MDDGRQKEPNITSPTQCIDWKLEQDDRGAMWSHLGSGGLSLLLHVLQKILHHKLTDITSNVLNVAFVCRRSLLGGQNDKRGCAEENKNECQRKQNSSCCHFEPRGTPSSRIPVSQIFSKVPHKLGVTRLCMCGRPAKIALTCQTNIMTVCKEVRNSSVEVPALWRSSIC